MEMAITLLIHHSTQARITKLKSRRQHSKVSAHEPTRHRPRREVTDLCPNAGTQL